jgi:type VI secretion system protein ImpG
MRSELLPYYERELTFLRQIAAEFAEKYPKIAGRLAIEPDKCEDPHVERLIEAFAFLAARIQRKIDDEFPEITESFLDILWPHYLAPIPSMSIVEFSLDPEQAKLQTGHTIAAQSVLSSKPVEGTPCRFRTCYPVTIWPVEVSSARFEPPAYAKVQGGTVQSVLHLELRTQAGTKFSQLRQKIRDNEEQPLDALRFFLMGEGPVSYALYEFLFNNVVQVELRAGADRKGPKPIVLSGDCLHPVGFSRDEGMLPYTDRSFMGYRLLQEYFAFPEKFLFFDLCELRKAVSAGAGEQSFNEYLDVLIYFNREFQYESVINAKTFRLNCAPIVNLFRQVAEPIQVTHTDAEYHIVPDVRKQLATEVYSVDSVVNAAPQLERPVAYQPFYSYKHGFDRNTQKAFWHVNRRKSERKDDNGTEVYLSLVDLDFNPSKPDAEILTVATTCTNRDLPSRLPFGGAGGDFQLEGLGIYSSIRCLRKPTPTLRLPLRRGAQWHLISHLAVNYLSLLKSESDGTPEALQEILRLYDFSDSMVTRRQIAGIVGINAKQVFRMIGSVLAGAPARGVEISLEFDEQMYVGSGMFLFASVLEHFLALYSSINSFTQLVVSTRQREGILKRWPPRAGDQIIL